MERIKKLCVLIICLNNGLVKGDIIEELLISVNRIQANMENIIHRVENMESTIKEQNSLFLGQLGVLEEEVKSVKKEQNTNHNKMNIQFYKVLEEVKKAGSINLNLEQCNEKYLKHSNKINEHLESLKEEMENVQKDNERSVEEINLNIEEGVKLTLNHSDKIIKQIKVFKEEVFSLEEENRKKFEDTRIHLLGIQKLYSDDEYDYYKVPVSNGTTLKEGAVSHTCETVGMRAVCSGPYKGCIRVSAENCVVTPLSSNCFWPMSVLGNGFKNKMDLSIFSWLGCS